MSDPRTQYQIDEDALNTIRGITQGIQGYKEDADRLAFISECERCVASGKWSIQVIDKSGNYTSKYFAKPPVGEPDIIYETRLDALRAAIDESMKGNNNE